MTLNNNLSLQSSEETEHTLKSNSLHLVVQMEYSPWIEKTQPYLGKLLEIAEKAYIVGCTQRAVEDGCPLDDAPEPVEVVLRLSNDADIQQLNKQFRGKDKPTNILSFPSEYDEDEDFDMLFMENDGEDNIVPPLGDLIMAFETCQKESDDLERPFINHIFHLVVHGILHLLDYDHERSPTEEALMEALEIQVLDCFDVPNPYTS